MPNNFLSFLSDFAHVRHQKFIALVVRKLLTDEGKLHDNDNNIHKKLLKLLGIIIIYYIHRLVISYSDINTSCD